LRKELESARKIFDSFALLDARKLSLVVGNHDVYGGVYTAEEIFTFPKRCKVTDYDRKVEEFQEIFGEVFEHTLPGKPGKPFPYAKRLDGVTLFGVNSVARYSRMQNPIGSNGKVDDKQIERLRSLLSSSLLKKDRKVVLIHHHFNKIETREDGTIHNLWLRVEKQTVKLHGKKELFKLFAAHNVELVLHGHIHSNAEYSREGIRFVNSGHSVLGVSPEKLNLTFIRVDETGITVELHTLPADSPATTIPQSGSGLTDLPIHVAA
jgi:3',5'-cyclic AMP phosphodiesterase CpdA